MNLYLLALFLHISAVVAAFSATTVLHQGVWRLFRADTAAEARAAAIQVARSGGRMPLFALALFLTGSWLVVQQWRWNAPWVEAGIAGLVTMVALGGAVLRPRLLAILNAIGSAEGPLPEAAARLRVRPLWSGAFIPPMIATGIMFDMVMKPSLAWSLGVIAICVVIALAAPMPRRKAP